MSWSSRAIRVRSAAAAIGLLIPLDLQPPGTLVHPGQVAAARGGRHPGEQRGHHGGGEEQQRAGHRVGRLPPDRGHDGADFHHPGSEQRPGPGLVGRHRVQRDQQGHVTQEREAEQPLGQADGAGRQEHPRGPDAAGGDHGDQRGLHQARAEAGEIRLRQPDGAYGQEHRRGQRVDGQRVRVCDPAALAEQAAGDLVRRLQSRREFGGRAQCASFAVTYRQRTACTRFRSAACTASPLVTWICLGRCPT